MTHDLSPRLRRLPSLAALCVMVLGLLTIGSPANARVFFGIGVKRFKVPAWVFLFYWGGLQVLSLLFGSGGGDNVAYAVHVGGFAAGVIAAMVWKVSYPYAEERLQQFVSDASMIPV